MWLQFQLTNNEAEYKALLIRLKATRNVEAMGAGAHGFIIGSSTGRWCF